MNHPGDFIYAGPVGPKYEQGFLLLSRRMLKTLGKVKEIQTACHNVSLPFRNRKLIIYQIAYIFNGTVIPLIHVIMENPSFETFRSVLLELHEICPKFKPLIVVAGPSKQERAAWSEVFNPMIKGYYLQYCQEVLNDLKMHCAAAIRNIGPARTIIRSFLAIPLLPRSFLQKGFLVLVRQLIKLGICEQMEPFLEMFSRKWLRGKEYETLSLYGQENRANNARLVLKNLLCLHTDACMDTNTDFFIQAMMTYNKAAYKIIQRVKSGRTASGRWKVSCLKNNCIIRDATADLFSGNLSIKKFLKNTSRTVFQVFHDSLRL